MPKTVRVRVDYAAIQGMFSSGGVIFVKMRDAAVVAKADARVKIHSRTGELAASLFYRTRVLRNACGFDLGARARHGIFVNDGTATPIYPVHGTWLSVPRKKGSTKRTGRLWVRGQSAQHFLEYGMIRGLESQGIPVPFSLHL